ncbi:MAG TPA: GNAT family protein [Stenotrophobium sp.]|nr:GNAT family protein [Stenotrophobium sp.]
MTNPQQTVPVFAPVTLAGRYVTLVPMQAAHHVQMCEAATDASIFQWFPIEVAGERQMEKFIAQALADQALGRVLPFVIYSRHDQRVVGSTRYMNIEATHRRAEIGATWLMPAVQRTPVNTECKYLLLRHAFEVLGLNRVELKTDALNMKSRVAMARLGMVEEGTLRRHMVTATGRIRDTVYFSVVREEWPQMRENLERRLAQPFSFQPRI